MQHEATPRGRTPQQEDDQIEHVVLHLVVDDPGPGLWSAGEIAKALGDEIGAADAIWRLEAAGLIHRHAQYLWPTRAAIRATQIETSI